MCSKKLKVLLSKPTAAGKCREVFKNLSHWFHARGPRCVRPYYINLVLVEDVETEFAVWFWLSIVKIESSLHKETEGQGSPLSYFLDGHEMGQIPFPTLGWAYVCNI